MRQRGKREPTTTVQRNFKDVTFWERNKVGFGKLLPTSELRTWKKNFEDSEGRKHQTEIFLGHGEKDKPTWMLTVWFASLKRTVSCHLISFQTGSLSSLTVHSRHVRVSNGLEREPLVVSRRWEWQRVLARSKDTHESTAMELESDKTVQCCQRTSFSQGAECSTFNTYTGSIPLPAIAESTPDRVHHTTHFRKLKRQC
jgi:hypothetical protein